FGFDERDVWCLFHSYAFDFSVWEIWGALLHGAKLVVAPYWVSRSPESFHRLLREEGVTVLNQTPSAFYQLAREDASVEGAAPGLALRWVIFGGEALEPQKLGSWLARHGDRPRLVNMYGITETTVHVTYHEMTTADLEPVQGSPIGVPIPDLRLYILGNDGQPLPMGIPGEIYVGGAGVATGYLGRPDLTAQSFVPDPFSGQQGARLYRTGDRARHLSGGALEFWGRADAQVKIHGFRIEPGEIEAALRTHPDVAEAVVDLREIAGDKRLVAYIVPRPASSVHVEEARAFLQGKLPVHMVPSAFMLLSELPLTSHGKLNRKALPDPGSKRPLLQQQYVAPRGDIEAALASAWAEALGVDRVGVHDNFFTLGGDSMRSVHAVALARAQGLEVSLLQVFQLPTIAGLAREVRLKRDDSGEGASSEPFSLLSAEDRAVLPDDVVDAYPLTNLQAGMLYHREEMPDSPVFHNVNSWRLRLRFDPEAFQRAVLHVTERHPILRTSFDMTGYSEPLQLVHREARFPVGVEDLRHLGASEQERILAKYFERQLKSPFDLSQAPQLRLQFHRRTDDTVQLTLTENHAILDGWSLHVIFDEILRSYFSLLRNGVIAPLAPLRTTYRDFVRLERQALASAELREFWDRALADRTISQVSRWPGHRRDPGKRRIKRFVLPLSADLATELRRLADTESVPLKSVFLAAHFRVTGYLSGVPDVLTSISYHGRPETTDGQRLCGLFLNLHPLRLFMTGGTWRSLLRQIFQAETEVLPYRRYPLAAIQKKWGREPLMDTQFVYLSFHVLEDFAQSGEVEITGFGEFVEETNFAVVACFSQSVGRPAFSLTLDLDRNVFSDGQAEAIKDYYLRTLRAMTRDDGSGRYEDFCPLSEAERHALTIEWNDSARRYAWERPVHELFAEQAARRPDQPCVRCEEGCLTFRELDRRAEALAGRLRRCSVQPESRVALCAERGLDMVVGILGVLKAGGAYVPMDPYYPQERLDFMLQDAEVSVVLAPEQWIGRFAVSGAGLVRLDAITEHLSKDLDDLPAQGEPGRACSGNLAYVIYTSGSTGRPKGVAVEHRMLTNYLSSIREELKPPEGASYALVSTFAADLGNTMIFTSLCTGGCLHVLSDAQVRDPNAMADYFLREPIDGLKIVPSHLAAILEHPQPETLLPRKWLILGGEALDDVWARKVQLLAPECRIFNEYGPTETTVAVAAHELRDPEPGRGSATVPIGRPLGNSLLYVLDSYFEPLPVGAAGELYIGGVNVARGYLRRPDLTAGKFVPNPFGGEAGARLYRSGDRVRYLSSGALEFLGRIDQQAKIHGFRVEPGEVEALLNGHPAVRQAAALLRHDTGEPRLVAYVVCHREQETGEEELLSFLAEKVPPFMVPAAVVILAALPLTPNGKLDRQALPAPGQGRNGRAAGRRRTKPKNYFELQLLNIWQELLKVDIIGMEDDFFELGGDSLLALRLIAQIRKQFQAKIPLAALIKAKTIEQLARLLLEERGVSWDLVVPIQPRGSKPPFFCVAPGHGGVLCYLSIAQHMGIERPFYGLQWPDLEQTQDPYLSIEEIACRYIEALRHVRPQGPYLLGGWSFGGLVAFEMARQLTAEGERVEHLALLDTRTPEAEAELFEMEEPLMKAYLLVEHAKSMAGPSTDDELPLSPRDLLGLDLDQQLDFLIWTLQLQERLPSEFGPAMIRRYLEVRLARMVAIRNYVPKLYRGRITLYRCEDIYRKASLDEVRAVFERADQNRTYGWKRFTAEPVEVQDIPGNHETLVYEPSSRVLAQRLRDCLDRDQLIL
ncbi:MAG TPA: amino acid adenylation domain-containing protein, partial [Thermoanaerobaculia bacterium]|nr:amino acid adenylation domain-containing protein [Thermoanaerobaculia bacterium]